MYSVSIFNKFVNTLKSKRKTKKDKLDKDNERRNMSDKVILEKYVNLEKSCLSETEKKETMNMLYKYKDTLSLRDDIGICPNKD